MQLTEVEWISKAQAAERLDLSPRRVLELAKQGKLQSSRVIQPTTGQPVIVIHAGSVEHYRDKLSAPLVWGDAAREPCANGTQTHVPDAAREPCANRTGTHALPTIGEILGVISRATRPRYALWLTLDQAADYSGLPAAILRAWVQSGKLAALDVGRRRGGRYRLSRRDLDGIRSGIELKI